MPKPVAAPEIDDPGARPVRVYPDVLRCSGRAYERHREGWQYAWGGAVPAATDVTVADALTMRGGSPRAQLTPAEVTWACGLFGVDVPLLVTDAAGARQLVVGLSAPELQVTRMLTVADVSKLAHVSKATVDSYRYRGYLPDPQIVKGRTPLWSRPVIARWLQSRPGSGWRSDVYGTRERHVTERTLPITRARERREQLERQRSLRDRHG